MKVSVLGCGRWGSFIAWYLNKIGKEVVLWGREGSPRFEALRATRRNPVISFEESILLTSDLSRALESATVILAISAQQLRGFCKRPVSYTHLAKRGPGENHRGLWIPKDLWDRGQCAASSGGRE